ncbi:MAG: hypothetical protein JKY89_07270 [Immundisolibacteraceae bacterium]|nr:hypothetical protein [Immundisolibacteraceae bacterium]
MDDDAINSAVLSDDVEDIKVTGNQYKETTKVFYKKSENVVIFDESYSSILNTKNNFLDTFFDEKKEKVIEAESQNESPFLTKEKWSGEVILIKDDKFEAFISKKNRPNNELIKVSINLSALNDIQIKNISIGDKFNWNLGYRLDSGKAESKFVFIMSNDILKAKRTKLAIQHAKEIKQIVENLAYSTNKKNKTKRRF